MRRKVAQPFENREREIWRGQLVREAFADQSSQFALVIQRVQTRDNTACAMTEQEKRGARFSRSCHLDNRLNVPYVVLKSINVEALTVGISSAAQVHGVYGQARSNKLLGRPSVIAAMGVKTWDDDDKGARSYLWTQRPKEDS